MAGLILAGQRLTASMLTTTVSNVATGSVTNSTTETVVGSMVIPPSSVNQGYEFHVEGTNDNSAVSVTVHFQVRIGTTGTISDLVISAPPAVTTQASLLTNLPWSVNGWLRVISAGSSGNLFLNSGLTTEISAAGNVFTPGLTQPTVASPINWTVSNFLVVTAQWSGTASASNTTRTIGGSLAALN